MTRFRFFIPFLLILLYSCAGIPGMSDRENGEALSGRKSVSDSAEPIREAGNGSLSADTEELLKPTADKSEINSVDSSQPGHDLEKIGSGSEISGAEVTEKEIPAAQNSDTPGQSNPQPLSRTGLISAVTGLVPDTLLHVTESGVPMGIVHDLDKNGYNDFLLLTIGNSGREDDEFIAADTLRDTGRLFFEKKEYIEYSILIFYQYPGNVKLRYTLPLSRELVLIDFETQTIREGRDFPYAVSVSFKTRGGTREDWIILNGQGISRFTLEETLSVIPVVEDIDDDGYVDLVIHEQAAEEGIGYETFLTWYKWDGSDFTEESSTNIVRNLRKYFFEMSELLLSGGRKRDELLDYLLLPESRMKYEEEGTAEKEIYGILFQPADEGGPSIYDLAISDVVYPVLMETPFTYETRGKFEFPFTLAIITDEGGYYYKARLVMNRNPFGENQFGFLPVE